MNLKFFYHSNCFDGFGSYYFFRRYVEDFKNSTMKGVTVSYYSSGYEPESQEKILANIEKHDAVIFADYCPSEETIIELVKRHVKFLILDHHATAAEKCLKIPDFNNSSTNLSNMAYFMEIAKKSSYYWCAKVFDTNRSGTTIVWDFLHHNSKAFEDKRPNLANYIEDRDLWRFKLNSSKLVNDYIQTNPFTYEAYDRLRNELDTTDLETIAFYGGLIGREKEKTVSTITDNKVKVLTYKNLTVGLFNNSSHWSETGNHILSTKPEVQVSIGVMFNFVKKTVMFSLRSRPDLDCSVLAVAWGGGGHRSAAGVEVDFVKGLGILEEIQSGQ